MQANHPTGNLLPALAAGIGVATHTSDTLDNPNHRGVEVVIDVTAQSGAALTVTIEGYDPVSKKYYTLLASAALAAVATTVLTVYPGVTVAANAAVSRPLPSKWRVKAANASGTVTATIAAHKLR